jgi:signal transduction histidine kinase
MIVALRARRRVRSAWERERAPDEAPLRRISWRLAALTVGLLCALLLVLGMTLYVTMQAAVQDTMQQRLEARVARNTFFAQNQLMARAYGPLARGPGAHGPGPVGRGPPPPGPPGPVPNTNGTFCVVTDAALRYVTWADGNPFGRVLPDPAAARRVMRTGRALFSTRVRPTAARYLLYSAPVRADGRTWGVIQAGMPEEPYLASLHLLVRTLVLVSALGLVAVGAISGVLVRRALRPIRIALRHQRDFVADAAHELRTPVTILRNAAELGLVSLADPGVPRSLVADQQAAYEQTLAQSNYLARLVDDLALLARADSGAVTLERAPVDLARLVAETMAGMEMLAEDRGACLDVVLPGPARVMGDAARLRQVLLILLDNALKHTPAGGTIAIGVQRQGSHAHVEVRDTGPGIAPRDLPHVFDRFYRADRERRDEGSGLGLAIARWIVETHGGRITAANAPDHGAVFTVILPLAR